MTPRALALWGVVALLAVSARAALTDPPGDSDSPLYSDAPPEVKQMSFKNGAAAPDPGLIGKKLHASNAANKTYLARDQAAADSAAKGVDALVKESVKNAATLPSLKTLDAKPPPARTAGSKASAPRASKSGGPLSWLGGLFKGGGSGAGLSGSDGGSDGDHPVTGDPASSGGPETDAGRRGEQAVSKAKSLAESFKSALRPGEGMPGEAAGSLSNAMTGAGPAPGAKVDPANPKSALDFQVAAQTGFKSSFAAAGLKPGTGADGRFSILDGSGKPASPADLERLRLQIASDPRALMKYPDLFSTVPRERFQQLKNAVDARPDLKDSLFKDVELTADRRDLGWTRSCDKVSGECNVHVRSASYKKSEPLSPDELDGIFNDIEKEQRDQELAENLGSHRIGANVRLPKADGAGDAFSGGESASLASTIDVSAPGGATGFARALRDGGPARTVRAAPSGGARDVPAPFSDRSKASRLGVVVAVAGATLLFGYLLLKRRDENRRME